MARVVIADRRSDIRHALRLLLEVRCKHIVTAEVDRGDVLLPTLSASPPDLLLLDCHLLQPCSSSVFTTLRNTYPHLYIIALNSQPEMRDVALSHGADVFVNKSDGPEGLLYALAAIQD